MHARWGFARMTPSKFLFARASEHELQNIPPHSRQWCRRRSIVNFSPHLVQHVASLSGCQVPLALADATSSLRVGMASRRVAGARRCQSSCCKPRALRPPDVRARATAQKKRAPTRLSCPRATLRRYRHSSPQSAPPRPRVASTHPPTPRGRAHTHTAPLPAAGLRR